VYFKDSNGENAYYIQSKYKNNPMEITLSTLFEDKNYQLKKYFVSFQDIKNYYAVVTNVMIFTNNKLPNPMMGNLDKIKLRLDSLADAVTLEKIPKYQFLILDMIDSKFRFKKNFDTVDILKDLCEDYTSLAKELADACVYKNNKNHKLIDKYKDSLAKYVIDTSRKQFKSEFINGSPANQDLHKLRKWFEVIMKNNVASLACSCNCQICSCPEPLKTLLGLQTNILNDFWNSVLNLNVYLPKNLKFSPNRGQSTDFLGKIDASEFNEFLDKFLLVANYEMQDLNEDVEAAIDDQSISLIPDVNAVTLKLVKMSGFTHDKIKSELLSCAKNNDVIDKDKLVQIFHKNFISHNDFHLISLTEFYHNDVNNPELQFELYDEEIHVKKVNDFLSQSNQKFLIFKTSKDEVQIALMKISQILEFVDKNLTGNFLYIHSKLSKDTLEICLDVFRESFAKICLFQLELKNLSFALKFTRETHGGKKLIFLTFNDEICDAFEGSNVINLNNFRVEHLTHESRNLILDQNLILQGHCVRLADVISTSDALDVKLQDIFQKELTAFEPPIADNKFYIKRKLKRISSESDNDENITFDEEDFLKFVEKMAIVSDQPGTGKSHLFKNLSKLSKEFFPFSLAFYMELNSYVPVLEKLKGLDSSASDFDKIILKDIIGVNNQMEGFIFEHFIEYEKKIFLFFDGFDEICPYYKKTVLDIIKYFNGFESVTIFISTRPEMDPYLQSEFNEIPFCFKPFTYGEVF
jgi:hypothetical protein